MANTYDITQKLQAIADAIENGGGGGGGGTTVIANPSGTPTDTLNTIQIASTIYDIAGGGGGGGSTSADNVTYDNTTSGLTATNVQDAIDENASDISTLNSNMTYKTGDTITFTGLIMFGVSMSSNRVEFMLPLDKPVDSGVTGVSVTAANLAAWTGSAIVSGLGIDRININGDRRTLDAATTSSSSTPSSTGKIYGISGSITMTLTGT